MSHKTTCSLTISAQFEQKKLTRFFIGLAVISVLVSIVLFTETSTVILAVTSAVAFTAATAAATAAAAAASRGSFI